MEHIVRKYDQPGELRDYKNDYYYQSALFSVEIKLLLIFKRSICDIIKQHAAKDKKDKICFYVQKKKRAKPLILLKH